MVEVCGEGAGSRAPIVPGSGRAWGCGGTQGSQSFGDKIRGTSPRLGTELRSQLAVPRSGATLSPRGSHPSWRPQAKAGGHTGRPLEAGLIQAGREAGMETTHPPANQDQNPLPSTPTGRPQPGTIPTAHKVHIPTPRTRGDLAPVLFGMPPQGATPVPRTTDPVELLLVAEKRVVAAVLALAVLGDEEAPPVLAAAAGADGLAGGHVGGPKLVGHGVADVVEELRGQGEAGVAGGRGGTGWDGVGRALWGWGSLQGACQPTPKR